MAYTGILLRGDTFANISGDLPIAREAAWAGEYLALGTNTGVNYYLNVEALSKIGKVNTATGAASTVGIKTSELTIEFDGTGDIQKETNYLLVLGIHQWRYEPLANITEATATQITIDGVELGTARLHDMTKVVANISAISANDITVDFDDANYDHVVVYNETTFEVLGVIATTGTTLTFAAAQTSGDIISCAVTDAAYNALTKVISTIP